MRSWIALLCFCSTGLANDCLPEIPCDQPISCDTSLSCFECEPSGWCGRDTLTGDWHGLRPEMVDNGVKFSGDITQFYQGVVNGGTQEHWDYGAHGTYQFDFDFDKMIGIKGLSLMVRAEHRFGEFIGLESGVLAPPALHAATPVPDSDDLYLTNVLFTQVVNQNIMLLAGKLDTLDGDRNPFASGRGVTQFMNTSLLLPIGGIPTVPLATLGAGMIYLVDGMPAAQLLVLNPTDTVKTSGLDELFEDCVLLMGSINVPLPIAGKQGIHTFSAAWSSKEFTSLGQDPRILTGEVPITPTKGSWLVWWSGTQYLYQDPDDPTKGWGLFGRLGASDGKVNPTRYFLNAGVGGQSPLPGRKLDQFGIGWFYNRASNELGPIATTLIGLGTRATGVEIYYNYAVTPYFKVTPDLQIIEPSLKAATTATVLGLRAELDF